VYTADSAAVRREIQVLNQGHPFPLQPAEAISRSAGHLRPPHCRLGRIANRSGLEDFVRAFGIKGAGQSGITAVGAAIANAVEDAIRRPVQSPSHQSRRSD
jgi:hypothetical protein